MNQPSDIRLSGTLITAAIVICGSLVFTVLIPVLSHHQQQPLADSRPTDVIPSQQFANETDASQSRLNSEKTKSSHDAIDRISINRMVVRTDSGDIPACDQFCETQPPTGEFHGTNLPMNVRIDVSSFADTLTRLADSVDEFVTTQRINAVELSAVTPVASNNLFTDNGIPYKNEELTQLNENLHKLWQDVECLRSESRTAISQLAEEIDQKKSTGELLDELRLTLTQHRKLLTDSTQPSPSSVTRIRQRPGSTGNPENTGPFLSIIPKPTGTQQAQQHRNSLDEYDQQSHPEIWLLPEAVDQVTAEISNETVDSGIRHTENPEPNAQTPGSPELSQQTRVVLNSQTSPPQTAMEGVTVTPAEPLVISKPVNNPASESLNQLPPLLPVDEGPFPQEAATASLPTSADNTSRHAELIVHKHSTNFVFPPAGDPLDEVHYVSADQATPLEKTQLNDLVSVDQHKVGIRQHVTSTKPITVRNRRPAVPQTTTESQALIQKPGGQRPNQITQNQRDRNKLLPKFVFRPPSHSTGHTRHHGNSQNRSGRQSTHRQSESRNHVSRDRRHTDSEHHAHQRSEPSKFVNRPLVFHRLSSSLLAAGRKRTID